MDGKFVKSSESFYRGYKAAGKIHCYVLLVWVSSSAVLHLIGKLDSMEVSNRDPDILYFYGICNLVFTSLFLARKSTGFAQISAKKQHSTIKAGKCELCLLLLRECLVGQWKFKCPVDCFICVVEKSLYSRWTTPNWVFFFSSLLCYQQYCSLLQSTTIIRNVIM